MGKKTDMMSFGESFTENLLDGLPMVEMCVVSKSLSVNRRNMQVFPTPESPSMSSRNKKSYCLAMTQN